MFKWRLEVEDARTERDNALGLLVDASKHNAHLAGEYAMAMKEIDALRSELEQAQTRIRELEEQ
jgi:hypothetical protein